MRDLLISIMLLSIASPLAAEETSDPFVARPEWLNTPTMRWVDRTAPIRSLIYSGESVKGQPTEVFAFYATPGTLAGDESLDKKLPGVVLVHGGGGTAFAEWVQLWAERGYAAIAMDLSGRRPSLPKYDAATKTLTIERDHRKIERERLPLAGLDHTHLEKFDNIGGDVSDDWPLHAVASVMKAHSLLRSFPEVNAERTALTGISWGGYTTCLVASLDPRFRAAVPVYGCGYLYEGESVQKPSIDKLPEDRRADWIRRYDPSSQLGKCQVPILFVNGTNDVHYPLDSYQRSFDLVPAPKMMRIEVKMPHGHPPGWQPKEIGLFIDSYLKGTPPLPTVGKPSRAGNEVRVPVTAAVPLKSAALHYTTGTEKRSDRDWTTVPATLTDGAIVAPAPPADANTWFVTVTDERDAMVSSIVIFE